MKMVNDAFVACFIYGKSWSDLICEILTCMCVLKHNSKQLSYVKFLIYQIKFTIAPIIAKDLKQGTY